MAEKPVYAPVSSQVNRVVNGTSANALCAVTHTTKHMPLPYNPTQTDGRSVADSNELRVLKAVRLFGHLRRQEVALAAWPKSSSKSAYIMACRTVTRLLEGGLLLERANTLGGTSLVLAAKGVARLREVDLSAQEGYDLAFDGPQFFHRTLGTNYLLEKAKSGNEVFGEFSLLKGWAPVRKEEFRDRFQKIPDGLITYTKDSLGYTGGIRPADWIEVESAYKNYEELKKVLSILTKSSNLNNEGSVVLHKLVFVFDGRQRHDRRVLKAIKQFLKENSHLSPELVLPEIILAKCFIDPPFAWHGTVEATAEDLLNAPNQDFSDLDGLDDLSE